MKRFAVALIVLTLGVAAQVYAAEPNLTYKQAPTTDDEKAVAQVFETLAAKATRDARGGSELYTQDAVIRWFSGTQNEPRVTEGRDKIYVLFSTALAQKFELRDLAIKAEGDKAEATGRTTVTFFIGSLNQNFVRQEERTWKLRREAEGWRIYEQEARNSVLTRQ